MTTIPRMRVLRRRLKRLPQAREAIALIEFAYALPILMSLAFTAVELANLGISTMQISNIAMTTADNVSRAMQSVPLSGSQLREVDINDALMGAQIQGGSRVRVLENGRVVISSLQRNSAGRQTIFWQRCKGKLNAPSRYGIQGATQGTTPGFTGMGSGTPVQADAGTAIIFAEITYDYEPLVGSWALGTFRIRREAAFYVRDERDISVRPVNPDPRATVANCNILDSDF